LAHHIGKKNGNLVEVLPRLKDQPLVLLIQQPFHPATALSCTMCWTTGIHANAVFAAELALHQPIMMQGLAHYEPKDLPYNPCMSFRYQSRKSPRQWSHISQAK
jgi:hypothetical protein